MNTKLLIILSLIHLTICDYQNTSLNAIVIPGTYNELLQIVVNKTTEYIIIYKGNENDTVQYPPRVTVSSNEASRIDPILVVAREKLGILSWQVPLVVETRTGIIEFMNTSRSLCPSNHYLGPESNQFVQNDVVLEQILSVSTASEHNVSVDVLVKQSTEFYITDSVEYNVTISPSEPKYFFYEFKKENLTYKYNYRTVVLQVDSDDDVCMMISIQNVTCPVYDLEREIQFEGYWETMTTKGGITLTQSKFPEGFYVVFVVKGDDYDCTGIDVNNTVASSRVKSLRFQIQPSITYSDYLFAILITIGLICVFYTIFLGIFCFCSRKYYRAMAMESLDADSLPTVCSPAATSSIQTAGTVDADDSSLSETDYDTVEDVELWKDIYRTKIKLSVADLARKNPLILTKKSNLYLWNVLTIAIFYGMPVIQLVIRYQRALIETGNQDLCYYNFLCAHPLGFLSDFNHVFSNIGYVVLGVLFILLVYRRQRMHTDFEFDKNFGIPQHYGLFYAMGCGLIMEGILSGSYHVCPNHYNFQFDSSFMYVMAVLCMVKIYQTRHPDINAKATTTFGILAVAVFLGMVGIMTATLAFWIFFTVIHILTCFVLTAKIYSMGRFKFDGDLFKRFFMTCVHDCRSGPLNALIPRYKGRWFLLFMGNVCNWALAAFGLYHHERDFATHLLGIFMGNTVLYTMFYIIMKLFHKEKVQIHVCVFLILSFTCWFSSLYFFIHKSISWARTPAESRQFNYHCTLMSFYDGHDIWHYLSATAMFFSFMLLLTLDDDLSHKHRSQIAVF